jgi:lysyl-tRNA synthetase class 2
MIYPGIISCFPQMRPEKKETVDPDEAFKKIGVPKEWIEAIKALGYKTVASLRSVEKPGKLANDLNGYKKKNKLDLPGLSPEVVIEWLRD